MPMLGWAPIAMPGMAIGIIGAAIIGIMGAAVIGIIGAVATGMVIVISAGRGIATGRRIGNGIRTVSNMKPIRFRSRTSVVTGVIMGWAYPCMGIIGWGAGACMTGGQGAGRGAGGLHIAGGGTSTTTFCRGARTSISSAWHSTCGAGHRAGRPVLSG